MNTRDDDRTTSPTDPSDRRLDEAIEQVKASAPSDEESAAVRARVWSRLGASGAPCRAMASDLPGFLAGTLGGAREALVGTHVRECVPCRRALNELRGGSVATPAAAAPKAPPRFRVGRLAAAAAVVAAAGLLATIAWRQVARPGTVARVVELEGQLLTGGSSGSLAIGSVLSESQAVRTAKGSWAAIELTDGSRVEINERTEVAVVQDGAATTVELGRGDVIVTAAHRGARNLFVATDECTVAVKGTVFTVGHGLKGSRVGVLDGEVHVKDRRSTRRLLPGDQATTREELEEGDLAEQVRWSRTSERYTALIGEIDAIAARLQAEPLARNVRHESALLDGMPEGTVLFAGLPNTPGNVERLTSILRERVEASPELKAWWDEQAADAARRGEPSLDELIDGVQRLSGSLGDEVAFGLVLTPDPNGGTASPVPVVVARSVDDETLRDLIDREVGESLRAHGHTFGGILDRQGLAAASVDKGGDVLVALDSGHLVAGVDAGVMASVADSLARRTTSGFPGTSFHETVEREYRSGAEVVLGIDLDHLVGSRLERESAAPDGFASGIREVGLGNLEHLVVVHGDAGRAVLSFKEARQGLASWLAEPAPMGSLDFVTPQATAVFCAVVKDPSAMLADIAALAGEAEFAKGLEELRRESDVDLRADVAAPLGGEITIALDGPILPEPSWKVVFEVYDADRLQSTLERLVARATADTQEGAKPALRVVELRDGAAHVLSGTPAGEIWYAFRDGYLVATPGRTLLESSLQGRELGASFATSPALAALLPKDGEENLSLLAYQDFASAIGPVLDQLRSTGALPSELGQAGDSTACLVFGRASERAITLGLRSAASEPGARLASFLRGAAVKALLSEVALHDMDGVDGEDAAPADGAGEADGN